MRRTKGPAYFAPLPEGPFDVVYADPPWNYRNRHSRGAAANQYATVTTEQICQLPVPSIISPNAVLFLWATYPMLEDALQVGRAWGFTYKNCAFNWVKYNRKQPTLFFGTGNWTRSNSEPCLLFVRGKIKRAKATIHQVVMSPVSSHSTKPDEVRSRIVRLCGDRPRIELFARKRCEGWDAWGLGLEEERS